ncbi:HyuA and DUF917 domain-containing protein [Phanerochaete sordida]|uniref:HyuA and DUF917 domain-containing protein n=1 Tax=Phanerochaete sordida TaxID=48140 RepID=A0A9P3G2D1_9APHY|nr:HyuA and DUF917 domain-containing protein [Phanerochaete sordida]
MLRIGVDVGGTNTDGVLIDITRVSEPNRGVLAHFKALTTLNVSDGIEAAVRELLTSADVSPSAVSCVSIGTTAFINAVLEQDARRLSKVAIIRICGPYTRQCPPFIDFPPQLRRIMDGHVGYIDGGLEIDGREIVPMKEAQIVEQCEIIKAKGLENIVLSGVFSPLDNEGVQEAAAAKIIRRELGPGINVVCSREVGQVSLLERENASILNASILTFAQRTIRHFKKAIRALNLSCPLFLTQNDGTLTSAAQASRLPIRTFASGPTNSMRGAAFLARMDSSEASALQGKSTIVVDIGGTTTDVGVLLPSGFPRQAAAFIEIGGVRTNFSMADVQSIGLGGGSRVNVQTAEAGSGVTVGPDSVGHNLTRDAKVFGGEVLTATDVVVADGTVNIGEKARVADVAPNVVHESKEAIKRVLERIVDKMKTSPEDVTLLLVGGGSIIAPDRLEGVSQIIRPPFFSVANAAGAAMAKVAGEIDTIEILQGRNIDDVIEAMKVQAIEKAIRLGASPDTTKIVEVANLPVQYVTNQATRIIVKAAGELSSQAPQGAADDDGLDEAPTDDMSEPDKQALQSEAESTITIDFEAYVPRINEKREWLLTELDLEWIAEGCGVLGTGGGGSPYPPFLVARQMLREGKIIKIVDPEDVRDDAVFLRCTFMGSPSVSIERLQGGTEIVASARALMKYTGMTDCDGAISDEIGGGNGVQPMIIAGDMGKPVLDADLMGRAYPNMYQTLPGAYNIEGGLCPCAISDGVGNTVLLSSAKDPFAVENILRTVTTEMGSRSGVSMAPLTRKTCTEYGIARSVSQAWRIGRAIATCKKRNEIGRIPKAILALQNGECLFIGKIINVSREVRKGFTWGSVTIAPLQTDEEEDTGVVDKAVRSWGPEDRIRIPFQNENLYVIRESSGRPDEIVVTVPDLITVLDSQSGSAIGTQDYRYGLRVTVIALAGNPKWTKTPAGLACGGPAAFGIPEVQFTPIAEYREPASVIQEFAH